MGTMDERDEQPQIPIGDVLGEVPLFREIQRVLLSSTGPVNWELARQVGIAMASWGTEDPHPTDEDRHGLEDAVRTAELAIADFTGMPTPPQLAVVRADRRATWVEANITSLRELIEPVASKLSRVLGDVRRDATGTAEAGGEAAMLEVLVDRMAPLLLGAQVGTVLGYLGQRVLGQFDVVVPRDTGALSFVVPNITEFEQGWSIPSVEFRTWVALHEVVHRFEFARPWTRPHFVSLVHEFTEHAEFDVEGLEQRLSGLDMSDPSALSEAFGNPGDLMQRVMGDEGRLLLARIQAFMSAAEGYAEHVMHAIAGRLLPDHARIDEAVRRRREGSAGHTRLVEQLLGVEAKLEQYRLGRSFADVVAERTDEVTLARMWDAAEYLPSMPELEEPTLWLTRIA